MRWAGMPALFLHLDEFVHLFEGLGNTFEIRGSTNVRIGNVIPGTHNHAAVDRHRTPGCMRENKSHTHGFREIEFLGDWSKVMAIGPKPMQPNDGGPVGFGWKINRVKHEVL